MLKLVGRVIKILKEMLAVAAKPLLLGRVDKGLKAVKEGACTEGTLPS
jgi:hypothetical protein